MGNILGELQKTRLISKEKFEKMDNASKYLIVSSLTLLCDFLKIKINKLEAKLAENSALEVK